VTDQDERLHRSTTPARPVRAPARRKATAAERERAIQVRRPARPAMRVHADGDGRPVVDQPVTDKAVHLELLRNAFGTASPDFLNAALTHLAALAAPTPLRSPVEHDLNAALALIDACGPENEMEAALAIQAAGAHQTAMAMLISARQTAHLPEQAASYTVMATRLMRASADALSVLDRLRRRPDQRVVVEHRVTVSDDTAVPLAAPPGGVSPDRHLETVPRATGKNRAA
jgi:hypothetical protein